MKIKLLFLIVLSLVAFSFNASACDYDGDGIDDIATYDSSNNIWRIKKSSDDSIMEVNFGENGAFPVPGYYLGTSNPAYPAFVSSDFFWKVFIDPVINEKLNFGRVDASYLGGHDFNGDGITDPVKLINRCSRLSSVCHENSTRFNVLYNNINGNETFYNLSPLVSGFFGKGLSPLYFMDANNDGKDDVCIAQNRRANKTLFTGICRDFDSKAVVARYRIGRLFNRPLAVNILGESYTLIWKRIKKTAETKVVLISKSNERTRKTLPSDGKVIVGDWLGTGSDQVGLATGGILTIFNPLDSSVTSRLMPAGEAVACKNNLSGRAGNKYLTTKNSCRVLNCE